MTVTEWLQYVQENDDTAVARRLLESLYDYRPGQWNTINLIEVTACFTAIRLDQMAKENRE